MASVRQAIERVYAFETPEMLSQDGVQVIMGEARFEDPHTLRVGPQTRLRARHFLVCTGARPATPPRSEEHTSELQSHLNLVCRLLLEKKKKKKKRIIRE